MLTSSAASSCALSGDTGPGIEETGALGWVGVEVASATPPSFKELVVPIPLVAFDEKD